LGLPVDSQTAIHEFERMRGLGVQFFVITWQAFWWIKCYPEFINYLRNSYYCALENENLIIFNLRNE